MLAIGNRELDAAPELGRTVLCWLCGKRHLVKYGNERLPDGTSRPTKALAFFRCGRRSYLCGIRGKEVRPRENKLAE